MTVEQINEYIRKYRDKASYFKNIGFENLSADFEEMSAVLESVINTMTQPNTEDNTSEIRNIQEGDN